MTGYGCCQVKNGTMQVRVEARSVNHRFLDINLSLPLPLAPSESELRRLVEAAVTRGRVEVRIEAEMEGIESTVAEPNLALARSLKRSLETIRDDLGMADDVSLHMISQIPGIVNVRRDQADPGEKEMALIRQALEGALDELDAMRQKEGRSLERDIRATVGTMEQSVRALEDGAAGMKDMFLRRLKERLAQGAADVNLSEDRLYQEAAVLAERSDISEEIARLRSHVDQLTESLAAGEPMGRKIDFLAQELNRECNTISAKARTAHIVSITLELRSCVERIREQARNIE